MTEFPLVQINVESFEYLTVIECSIYKSKHGKLMSENLLIIFFINKETESCREKNLPHLYKNVKIASLFTRSEYSTSCIGIQINL